MGSRVKKVKMESPQEDRISKLPDEILISILSLLPSKQSARTSVLAKSWKNLWKHSVKQVLIVFPSLNFDFVKNMTICYKKAQGFNVHDILTNCPLLEQLSLIRSLSVENLNISCKLLKKLEIIGCCNLRKMEFFAPKLVSFKYNGPNTVFVFGDVPSLVELSLVESYCKIVVQHKFKQFEPILDQLERINLIQDYTWIDQFPKIEGLRNIKKVRLDIRVWDYQRPLRLFDSIFQALPSLEVFFLRLYRHPDLNIFPDQEGVQFENHQKHGLRVFKMDGFRFGLLELKCLDYVVERAVSLEKVVLRVCTRESVESDEDTMDDAMREAAMYEVEQFDISSMVKWPTRFVLH